MRHFSPVNFIGSRLDRLADWAVVQFVGGSVDHYANPLCTAVLVLAVIFLLWVLGLAFIDGRIAEVAR